MRSISGFLFFLLIGFCCNAQSDAAENGRRYMFDALMGAGGDLENAEQNLEKSAWEALAYIEEEAATSEADLQEAVPDYYQFSKGILDVRLVDQAEGSYGSAVKMVYSLMNGNTVALRKLGGGKVEIMWEILYLDTNYMALDMGDIRVFFIHTKIKQ